jgi:Matrixin
VAGDREDPRYRPVVRALATVVLVGALALTGCSQPVGAPDGAAAPSPTSSTAPGGAASAPASAPSLGAVEGATARGQAAANRAKAAQWRAFDERSYGWELCPEPIQVIPWFSPDSAIFVGSPEHVAKVNQKLGEGLHDALELWSKASGLTFQPAPMVDMRIDPDTGLALPADGSYTPRSIIVALISEKEAALINGRTVGLATQLHEQADNGLIDSATAAYDADYLRTASHDELVNLFAHEIGHALGLGHSPGKGNIMDAIVTDQTHLGPGDVAGIQTLTRPCSH